MNDLHFEIERKYLIRMPDPEWLAREAEATEIRQTYLLTAPDCTERVRKRGRAGSYVYTHTIKRKLSDLRRIEDETEIGEKEYEELLRRADPARRPVEKVRWCFTYEGQFFELDVFPFWKDRAYLEIELGDERQQVTLPPSLRVIREVTDDPRYTNSALALAVPYEEIGKDK